MYGASALILAVRNIQMFLGNGIIFFYKMIHLKQDGSLNIIGGKGPDDENVKTVEVWTPGTGLWRTRLNQLSWATSFHCQVIPVTK